MNNEKCVFYNNSIFVIDEDYQMCYNCFFYYDERNPKILRCFENRIIIKGSIALHPCINCHDNDIT